MADTRLDTLLEAYFDGVLASDEKHELERRLLASAEDRHRFWQWAEWDALLSEWGEETESLEAGEGESSCPSKCIPPLSRKGAADMLRPWVFTLLGVFVVAFVGWLVPNGRIEPPHSATLVSTINARWSDDAMELSLISGDNPTGRLLRLLKGTAEFRTLHGATVRMEGPAAMRIDGATTVYVQSGKVVCRCPTPESRLTVNTAQTRVIDLGTEFTVDARPGQSTRVAVLSGEVKVGDDKSATVLRKGEAVEVWTHGVTMLTPEEVNEMLRDFDHEVSAPDSGENWLINGDFENSNEGEWIPWESSPIIQNGRMHIGCEGNSPWPLVRQIFRRPDLSGRVYAASVRAMQSSDDPLHPMQHAVLKLVFKNHQKQDFAFAAKYFQFGGEQLDKFVQVEVAAIAPPGTTAVSFQLLMNSRNEKSGTVIFDDAVLRVGEPMVDDVSKN